MLFLERLKLIVQKHQARDIFQYLHLFVALALTFLQILFADQTGDSRRFVLAVPALKADLLDQLALAFFQKCPPCKVARFCGGVG